MRKVVFNDTECDVIKGIYPNRRTRLDLHTATGPYATATVNVPEIDLSEGETLIKDYSENEGILAALIAAGIVENTGKQARGRFVNLPIVRVLI